MSDTEKELSKKKYYIIRKMNNMSASLEMLVLFCSRWQYHPGEISSNLEYYQIILAPLDPPSLTWQGRHSGCHNRIFSSVKQNRWKVPQFYNC